MSECSYLQENLRFAALADAGHDFFDKPMKELGYGDQYGLDDNGHKKKWEADDNIFLGLPKACGNAKLYTKNKKGVEKLTYFSEAGMIFKLFDDIGNPYGIKQGSFDSFTRALLPIFSRNNNKVSCAINNRDYDIKILNKNGITNTKQLFEPGRLIQKDLIDFFESTDMYLLFDTDKIRMVKMITSVLRNDKDAKSKINIRSIINREYLNDSHTIEDEIIHMPNLVDIGSGIIEYSSNININSRNMFYSKYKIYLKPLDNINNIKELSTEITIKDGAHTLFKSSDRSDKEIKALCHSMYENHDFRVSLEEVSARYQAKRAGDWLQAISCLDTTRMYRDKHNITRLTHNGVMVTIDHILVSYCLLIGVDVILVNSHFSSMIYFKGKTHKKATKRTSAHDERSGKRGRFDNSNNESNNNLSGGGNKSEELFSKYLNQLKDDIYYFEQSGDSNYTYYKYAALIILGCVLNTPRTHDIHYYNKLQALFYDILPADEGTMSTDNEEVIKFFDDEFTSGCVTFAARQVALHSIGQRRGTIESYGHEYHIPDKAYSKYKELSSHVESLAFDQQKDYIIKRIERILSDAPKIHNTSGISKAPVMRTGNNFTRRVNNRNTRNAIMVGKGRSTRRR